MFSNLLFFSFEIARNFSLILIPLELENIWEYSDFAALELLV